MRRPATPEGQFIAALAHRELRETFDDKWICDLSAEQIRWAIQGARKVWQAAEQDYHRWAARADARGSGRE